VSVDRVVPAAELEHSYLGFVDELTHAEEKPVPFVLGFPTDDFGAFLARLDACSQGLGLPRGFVPHSTFWLVRDRAEVVGVSNVRHALTPALRREGGNIGYGIRPSARRQGLGRELLRQTLAQAARIGMSKALLTCAKTNAASVRIILANGGVLESEEFLPERGEVVQRFWIDTSQ
jgi:predicted acetyltransferase